MQQAARVSKAIDRLLVAVKEFLYRWTRRPSLDKEVRLHGYMARSLASVRVSLPSSRFPRLRSQLPAAAARN